MCDSAITAIYQDSYAGWLACKLRRMAHDILNFATYDEFDEHSVETYKKYIKDAINFLAGAHTCERFLYGSIGLDAFCAAMIEDNLREFLIDMPKLPSELVTKYNLIHSNDGNDDDDDDDDTTPAAAEE